MIPQLYVDLDGVLANLNEHYYDLFGQQADPDTYSPPDFYDNIRAHGQFFRTIPMMEGAQHFWEALCEIHPNPIILTGYPYSVPESRSQKRAWVAANLGPDIPVICCHSADKCLHGKPGDILLDDRLKYSKLWINMGGVFVHHTSNVSSLEKLGRLYGGTCGLP